ncbi:MAG: electron transfer flavoprotein subunit beta/FixA family protein [Desulfobacterales bacterium]|nr:electron transfer flavoprotein subunit beta/FixA family protein [Desulfobacterales bacterium]
MKILVCIKYVPDLDDAVLPLEPNGAPGAWDWEAAAGRINRYDEYALEASLRLKTSVKVSRIDALTVGPGRAREALRRALGMGVDHGVLIQRTDRDFPSPFTIGGLIAAYAKPKGYDLVLCGAMSEDLMQGQVGPVVAGLLDRPCLTSVHALDGTAGRAGLRCEREAQGGRHEILEIDLPAVVTVQSGETPPRYPALSKLLRANQYPLETVAAETLNGIEARQRMVTAGAAVKKRQVRFLDGSAEEKAHRLAALLRARGRT